MQPRSSCVEEEVFVDAEEEVTPRRSSRKRRSTAGSCCSTKRPKQGRAMPVERSPGKTPKSVGPGTTGRPRSPVGPPPPNDDAFWTKMGGMLGGLESRMKQETEAVKDQLGKAIGDLGSRVQRTEMRLDSMMDEVNALVDRKLENILPQGAASGAVAVLEQGPGEAAVQPASKSYAEAVLTTHGKQWKARRQTRTPEDQYWECRKSLRIRPLAEGNEEDAVRQFMRECLKLDSHFIDCVGVFAVRRIPYGPAAKIKAEAVVTFQDTDTRDAVRRAARNLAGRSSDYGVRLEIPNYLRTPMADLQSVSYDIRRRFPEAKTNVLMDDSSHGLVLDFSVDGKNWKRITSVQAKQRRKKKPANDSFNLGDDELDNILDGESEVSE